jgi:hypothetical protein
MMGDERLTEGSICDINVAYNSKRVGYTTSIGHPNAFGTSHIRCAVIRNMP